ncbi:MAG TPA: GNAT family N-acetyltransferase [Rhizomicrobium sp.]|nr:GNAT family N-acetyltransferase [Rhizomicrobium sp.]
MDVFDNTAKNRFELQENEALAFATYRHQDNIYTIPHVEAAMELRGKGTAGRLMEGITTLARAKGFKIRPTCPYAVAWFRRHPEQHDLVG